MGRFMPQNPAAPHHLPWFFTAPGATDGLFIAMIVLLIVACVVIGNVFFYLYQLPMQMAGRGRIHKIQAQVVAVLALAVTEADSDAGRQSRRQGQALA